MNLKRNIRSKPLNWQINYHFWIAVLVLLGAVDIVGVVAYAEGAMDFGNRAYGVNRRVQTFANGSVEVEGTFAVTATLPSRANRNVELHDNRPNPYLGGDVGGIEFDGGLIWEPEAARVNGRAYDPGWSAFVRGGGVPNTNPRVWLNGRSEPWRVSQTPPAVNIDSLMRFTFREDGRVSLHVGAMPHGGTFFHSGVGIVEATAADPIAPTQAQSQAVTNTARLGTANVKRVAAMTRAGGDNDPVGYNDELDGAQMTAIFSGGQVRRRGGGMGFWHPDDVNQAETGYDAAADNAPNFRAWDMVVRDRNGRHRLTRNNAGALVSRRVVEFPRLDVGSTVGRANADASHTAQEDNNSRYTRETVEINLRAAGVPEGRGRR